MSEMEKQKYANGDSPMPSLDELLDFESLKAEIEAQNAEMLEALEQMPQPEAPTQSQLAELSQRNDDGTLFDTPDMSVNVFDTVDYGKMPMADVQREAPLVQPTPAETKAPVEAKWQAAAPSAPAAPVKPKVKPEPAPKPEPEIEDDGPDL